MDAKELQLPTQEEIDDESGIDIINIQTVCRLCATSSERLLGIFGEEGVANDLANKVNLYLPIKVAENDELPLQCCCNCASTILAWHEFVINSVESERKFRSCHLLVKEKSITGYPLFDNENDNTGFNQKTKSGHFGSSSAFSFSPVFHEYDNRDASENEDTSNISTKSDSKCGTCGIFTELKLRGHRFDKNSAELLTKKSLDDNALEHILCHICNAMIKSADLKEHKAICKPSELFYKSTKLETKTCNECDKAFKDQTLLKKHVKEIHNVELKRCRRKNSEITFNFFCDVCQKGFTRKFDMEKHMKRSHAETMLKEKGEVDATISNRTNNVEFLKQRKVQGPDGKAVYQCDYCNGLFRQSYNLIRHRTIHTGVRAFFCHICGKSFRIYTGLSRHINGFHNKIRRHCCEICNKKFTTRLTKLEHMNIHGQARPFICEVCGKGFKQKSTLYVHKIFHTSVYNHLCSVCGKRFKRNQDLKVHQWLHTGYKPHKCSLCEATFRLSQGLRRHVKIHEKASECVCNFCGSVFSQERYLKVHMKIHRTTGRSDILPSSST